MRNLPIDSTMVNQEVHVVGVTVGRLATGAAVDVAEYLPLSLVTAPTYVEVDALADDARGALQVTVRV